MLETPTINDIIYSWYIILSVKEEFMTSRVKLKVLLLLVIIK